MGAVSFIQRVNISIAGHSIAHDFHLSDLQLGKLFSAFFISYGLFQIAGGWAVDRLGPRRVLALAAVLWAAFSVLTASFPVGLAQAFLMMWSVRFLLGMSESVMFPSSNRWVANWIPTAERGLANGLIFAGVGVGSALTPPLIRYAMVQFGWRASFCICGGVGLLAAAGWYSLARDHPDQHSWVNDAERKWIHEGIPQGDPVDAPKITWSAILGSKDVWAIALSYFCLGYTPGFFFTWFFIYLNRVRGMSLQTASYYGMLPFIAMSLGAAFGGWLADVISRDFGRWWGRCGVAAFGMAGSGASAVLAAGAGSIYIAQSSYWTLSADLGKGSSGTLSGFINMACIIGDALAAIATPAIAAHYGWTASFLTSATFCVIGGTLWLVVNPNRSLTPRANS
jgi:ACS family glucarate transporter-like MFS transporter